MHNGHGHGSLRLPQLGHGEPRHTAHGMSQNKQVIPWDRLETHRAQDTAITTLLDVINRDIPDNRDIGLKNTREYSRVRTELHTTDPVVLNAKRAIIPTSLQAKGRKVLQAAHQGTTGRTAGAMGSIHWPGMRKDFARKMAACTSCDKCASSRAGVPSLAHPAGQEVPHHRRQALGLVI